jgi:hypothetical protein
VTSFCSKYGDFCSFSPKKAFAQFAMSVFFRHHSAKIRHIKKTKKQKKQTNKQRLQLLQHSIHVQKL